MLVSSVTKAHKIRKIVSYVTLISGVVTGGFAVVAFIDMDKDKNFVIDLNQEGVRLALDTTPDVQYPTTYLMIDDYPQFTTGSYSSVMSHGLEQIDTEKTNNKKIGLINDGELTSFFKYTFYIKNLGSASADYTFSVNINNIERPSNVDYGYDSLLRVMLFENESFSRDHNFSIYAKQADEYPADDPNEGKEIVSRVKNQQTKEYEIVGGYAEKFPTSKRLLEHEITDFFPGSIMRYTVVVWLEGSDPQCEGVAPKDGSLQLGININAIQQEDEETETSQQTSEK